MIAPRDQAFYDRIGVPGGPTLCPEEMARMRLSFRNEVDLYKRKCSKTGKDLLTYYPPHAPHPIYDNEIWWGDAWNPLDYGRAYNPSRPFLDQFAELYNAVPKSNIYMVDSENCDYTNYATHNKNCYLFFGSWHSENCFYGNTVLHCLSCLDCHYLNKSQWCYECVDCNDCYEIFYSQNSQTCNQSWFLYDCKRCENCIGCWNMRDKKYHIWNKPVGKEEYEQTLAKLKTSYKFAQEFLQKFRGHVSRDAIHKSMIGENNENATGNFIYNSKNVVASYNVWGAEDIYYSDRTANQKDQYFCTGTHEGNMAYYTLSVDYSHTVICGMNGEHHANTAYCIDCYGIENCLACNGLRHKKYCILNKQYSREEYELLMPDIVRNMQKVGEWGEFFPLKMNPFNFNKTVAYDYFPLSKEEALKRGYCWKDEAIKNVAPQTVKLPDNTQEAGEEICDELLVCEITGRNYRIVPQELKFLKRMGLPLPRTSWDSRYQNRINQRTPRQIFARECAKCGKEIKTTYAAGRPEKVYCEQCYLEMAY